jgi:hypothetical protein
LLNWRYTQDLENLVEALRKAKFFLDNRNENINAEYHPKLDLRHCDNLAVLNAHAAGETEPVSMT